MNEFEHDIEGIERLSVDRWEPEHYRYEERKRDGLLIACTVVILGLLVWMWAMVLGVAQ